MNILKKKKKISKKDKKILKIFKKPEKFWKKLKRIYKNTDKVFCYLFYHKHHDKDMRDYRREKRINRIKTRIKLCNRTNKRLFIALIILILIAYFF